MKNSVDAHWGHRDLFEGPRGLFWLFTSHRPFKHQIFPKSHVFLTQAPQALVSHMSFEAMMEEAKSADGFLAALDQSGGSTPKALRAYGVPDDVSRFETLL